MVDFIKDHSTLIFGALGAITLAFLTPFSSQIIARRFSTRPAFSVDSSTMNNSLQLTVKPANRAARKRKLLGVKVRGLNITNAAKLEDSTGVPQWRIDLSNVRGMRDIFVNNQDYDFEFFFDPNNTSDKVTIRYIEIQSLMASAPSKSDLADIQIQTVRNPNDLVTSIRSNASLFCDFDEERSNLSRAFPTTNSNTHWANVHDGKELIISNVDRFELTGTKILAEPRYAWVLNFHQCTNIALRNLTIGHTKSGYCQGGVLRFEDCENITLENCDLFGCGTYGLELINCRNIEIVRTTIKECTYGAANLTSVSNAAFRECHIRDNGGFELFTFDGVIEGVTLQDCIISKNKLEGAIFCFSNRTNSGFYVHGSSCTENQYAQVSNIADRYDHYFDTDRDNRIVASQWTSYRS